MLISELSTSLVCACNVAKSIIRLLAKPDS